jgi:hypothetical protein
MTRITSNDVQTRTFQVTAGDEDQKKWYGNSNPLAGLPYAAVLRNRYD